MKCVSCNGEFEKLYAPSRELCKKCYTFEYNKKYYEKHSNKIKGNAQKWYKENRKKALVKFKENREIDHFDGMREIILERDKHKCTVCNSTDKLVVHHKDFNGRGNENPNNSEDNLVTLCKRCHIAIHRAQLIKAGELKQWSRKYPACIECGTTKTKHHSHGLCKTCSARLSRGKKI